MLQNLLVSTLIRYKSFDPLQVDILYKKDNIYKGLFPLHELTSLTRVYILYKSIISFKA